MVKTVFGTFLGRCLQRLVWIPATDRMAGVDLPLQSPTALADSKTFTRTFMCTVIEQAKFVKNNLGMNLILHTFEDL